jgi:hypothetical protein
MRYVVGFFRFWYEFIVGDDWLVAVGVVVALALTWLLAHNDVSAWWVMPVAVVVLLLSSLWRATRSTAP